MLGLGIDSFRDLFTLKGYEQKEVNNFTLNQLIGRAWFDEDFINEDGSLNVYDPNNVSFNAHYF